MTVRIDLGKVKRLGEETTIRGVKTALARAEAILRADILSRPGSGRTYKRGKSVTHKASAPGEPPAVDTGNLRNKTQADTVLLVTGDSIVGRVIANTEYAHALEVGTEKIAPRPYLSRLKAEHAPDLVEAFRIGAKRA